MNEVIYLYINKQTFEFFLTLSGCAIKIVQSATNKNIRQTVQTKKTHKHIHILHKASLNSPAHVSFCFQTTSTDTAKLLNAQ